MSGRRRQTTDDGTDDGRAAIGSVRGGSLAVIVVSYNVRDLLRACLSATLASLAQSGYEVTPSSSVVGRPSSTIIVIDNASADGSADMVAAEFPQVRLVASTG